MQIDKSHSFRSSISPWHDKKLTCAVKALVMFMIVLFATDGIKVARQNESYNGYIWVPVLLFVLSFYIFFVNLIRLIKRYERSAM